MAKATDSTADKAPRASRRPRQPAASTAVGQDKESGAKAPVSSSGAPGAAGETATQDSVSSSGTAFGIGSFPDGWKWAQTSDQSAPDNPVQSSSWDLPAIAEFPADVTLVNNTRNTLVVRVIGVRLRRFGEVVVQAIDAAQYQEIQRELAPRALRERWDSDMGLQVKHGEE